MTKRLQWTKKNDKALKKLISLEKGSIKWDVIAHQLNNLGIMKSSKQCRERWLHQLDPNLKKKAWTDSENINLFILHKKFGNCWKKIAKEFEGRTDNSVKNSFFSIIRKGLRNACKVLGKISNTKRINVIKPKVLADFISREMKVDFGDLSIGGQEKGFLGNERDSEIRKIDLAEFVKKFAFNKFVRIYSEMNDKDIFVVEKCVEFLFELNRGYVSKRIRKIKKKRSEEVCLRTKRIEESVYISEEENLKKEEMIFSKISKNSVVFKNSFNENKNINEFFLKIKKIIKREENKKENNTRNNCDLKKHLIRQFEEIKKISELALNKIWMASEEDLNNYTKKEFDILEKIKQNYNNKQKSNFLTDIFEKEKPLEMVNLKNSEKILSFKNTFTKPNIDNLKNSGNFINTLKNSQNSQKNKNENFMNFSNGNRSFGMTSNILNASKLKISGFNELLLKSEKSDFCFKSNFEQNLKKSNFDPIFGNFKKSTYELDFLHNKN